MILLTYGTRPEYIKIKPLIIEMVRTGIPFKTLFTGQHKDIGDFSADYNYDMVELTSNRLNNVLINCLTIPDNCFDNIKYVLVQGDTTSVVGIALAAMHRKIKIIHLEAGLRTYDYDNPYPEEYNRKLVSTLTSIHLCPTEQSKHNLKNENVLRDIYVVGNTVLDNLLEYKENCEYLNEVLITLHRRENHDKIVDWFEAINMISLKYPHIRFTLPIHPNPNVNKHRDILIPQINVVDPLPHNNLIEGLTKTKLVITDSGGIQEECSFLNKKCLVCRETTERPESLDLTSFMVKKPEYLMEVFDNHIHDYEVNHKSPYGDGRSSEKICEIFKNLI